MLTSLWAIHKELFPYGDHVVFQSYKTAPSHVGHQNIWDALVCFLTEDLVYLGLMLSRFALKVQAEFLGRQFRDLSCTFEDGTSRSK